MNLSKWNKIHFNQYTILYFDGFIRHTNGNSFDIKINIILFNQIYYYYYFVFCLTKKKYCYLVVDWGVVSRSDSTLRIWYYNIYYQFLYSNYAFRRSHCFIFILLYIYIYTQIFLIKYNYYSMSLQCYCLKWNKQ